MLSGFALDVIGFPEKAEYGSVSDQTIWQLGFVYAPVASLMILVTVYFFFQYRITKSIHQDLVAKIKSRRAAAKARE